MLIAVFITEMVILHKYVYLLLLLLLLLLLRTSLRKRFELIQIFNALTTGCDVVFAFDRCEPCAPLVKKRCKMILQKWLLQ